MNDILSEAQQEYVDNYRIALLKKALPFILLLTVVGVSCMGIRNWYVNKGIKAAQVRSELLIGALNKDGSATQLIQEVYKNLADEANDAVAALAKFALSEESLKNHDKGQASNYLQSIINNSNFSEINRSLAKLKLIAITLEQERLVDADNKLISNYLNSFKESSPFYVSSLIYKTLYQLKENEKEGAASTLKQLQQIKNISDSAKSQVEALASEIMTHKGVNVHG